MNNGDLVRIIASFKDSSNISLFNDKGIVNKIYDNSVDIDCYYFKNNNKINRIVNLPKECIIKI